MLKTTLFGYPSRTLLGRDVLPAASAAFLILSNLAMTIAVAVLVGAQFAAVVPLVFGAIVGLMSGRNRGIANASKNKIIWTALAILLLSTALLLLSPGSTTGDFFSLWPVAVLLLAAVVALIGEDSRIANAYNTALFLIACNLALGVVLVPAFLS